MIQAGQYIDTTLGVKLGLATMTAAACGQVVSDVSGVLFGGTLESIINRWMPNNMAATLSTAQRQSTWGRYASLSGAVLCVTCGCALGALTLFFVDLDARDRIQRAAQFKQVLTDMTQELSNFDCREVVVHLAVKTNQHYDWKSLNQDESGDGVGSKAATTSTSSRYTANQTRNAPVVRMQSLDLLHPEQEDDSVIRAARQQDIVVSGQRLFVPIRRWEENKHDEIWAVVEFEKDNQEISESDIQNLQTLTKMLGIFMHRMAD
jgi:membrane protein YqaA with SNARE-associated domain